jgi:peptide/nickel transport system substrate-binding protein
LTVTIELRHVALGFADQPLADMPILPKHLWQNLAPGQAAPPGLPVGSGPYRLVSARPAGGYVFRANPGYFMGPPRAGEIAVPIIGGEQALYAALHQRRVDALPLSLPQTPAADFAGTLGIALRTGPSYAGTALLFNLRRLPFARLAARRAVASALDLGGIASAVAPATAAEQGFIHPASPWAFGAPVQRYDPSAARHGLAPLKLTRLRVLAPNNDPVRLEAGRQVVLALGRAGAAATLTPLSPTALAQAIGESGSQPNFDAAIESTPPLASYDPDYLATMFGSDSRLAPLNFGAYRSHAFDVLAARVAAAPDAGSRRQATREELSLLAADAPSVPLFFSRGTFAYRPSIYDGWVFVKGTGILDKRSFLAAPVPAAGAAAGASNAGGHGSPSSSGSAFDLVNILSVLVLVAVLALAVAALRQRRSRTGKR